MIVKTLRNGALRIDVRRYADGRYGFDWQPDKYQRRKIRLRSQGAAEQRAREMLGATKAGTVDLLKIDPDEYAEFLRWKAERRRGAPVPQLVTAFLDAKRSKGRSSKTVRGLESNLTAFAKEFPQSADKLTRNDVEAWLNSRDVGPRRWNNLLADIVALMRFARRDGALGADLTPVELIERRTVKVSIQTFSPGEMRKILSAAEEPWLPSLVLGAFCGLRPEETCPESRNEKPGVQWENILWDKKKVDVPAEVSKTRRRRFAPLTPAAAAFLKPWREASGPVAPDTRFCHYLPALRVASGLPWRSNGLRHSFASYRLALTRDTASLALEMGNSPAMIFRHYLDLKHRDEAREWFSIRPE